MAMSRMNKVNLMTRGKNGGENRGRDEDRYREHQGYDRERGNQRMHDEPYGREYNRGRSGGADSDYGRKDWEDEGRYRGRMNYDDDGYGEGGGRYAGNFRHSQNPREHEAGQAVKFDEHKAKEWVSKMKNNDGTVGEHFRQEQAEQMRNAHCPNCDKHEFWAAMNMMYSDYCDVAKKMNVDKPEFYAGMAKAFLMDADAGDDKLAKYMQYVAGK